MYIAISILIIIASLLLTLVVLIQNSKGGGLAANFASGNQTFGVRQTADFLEKASWTLMALIIALSIVSVGFSKTEVESGDSDVATKAQETVEQQQAAQAVPEFEENAEAPVEVPAETPAE